MPAVATAYKHGRDSEDYRIKDRLCQEGEVCYQEKIRDREESHYLKVYRQLVLQQEKDYEERRSQSERRVNARDNIKKHFSESFLKRMFLIFAKL